MNKEIAMLNKLTHYVWMIVFILVAYPCTSLAGSATPTAGEIWKEPVTGMEFVWVPGGCYETEVTQGQWKQIMGDNPAKFQKGDNYPFENALWEEMEKFILKLVSLSKGAHGFRLPTEAEWEYACRSGGKQEKYAGGSDLDAVAWYQENSDRSTHSVAMKAPNGLGLFDMNGNVNEWCVDTYRSWAYSKHERNNPLFREEGYTKVYRGGSWNSKQKYTRCAARSYEIVFGSLMNPYYRKDDLGFRLVRNK